MDFNSIVKRFLPRSFYGRAVLILFIPIIVIQILLSIVFIQRHYERVTAQMTENILRDIRFLTDRIEASDTPDMVLQDLSDLIMALQIDLQLQPDGSAAPDTPRIDRIDLAGREILRVLEAQMPAYRSADLLGSPGMVLLWLDSRHGVVQFALPRRLVTTSNPHQLLVIMFLASALMALIAFQFLRLQIRPIRRLGQAAEAYGRGELLPLHASGAREIRAASLAFIDMRTRIDQQAAQRKLMLSGVSHDMRTPLTRMRLILSMMEDTDDTAALRTEIMDLENLLNGFLDYSRGQDTEDLVQTDLSGLTRDMVQRLEASGQIIGFDAPDRQLPKLMLRRGLVERALDNLLTNALRHGRKVRVSIRRSGKTHLDLSVDDDGPGIGPADRARAVEPFVRLDDARNRDTGGGLGLGLAIVAETMRSHGGALLLTDSPDLGGLRATLRFPLATSYSR